MIILKNFILKISSLRFAILLLIFIAIASALGTLIGGAEIGAEGGFAYSDSDGLLTFQSGSTKFVVLMYTSGSS